MFSKIIFATLFVAIALAQSPDETPDCSRVLCARPECQPGEYWLTRPGECCPECAKPPQCNDPVNCFANPCDVQQEPCQDGFECVANYCGGCNALCVVSEKKDCSETACIQSLCPDGSPRQQIGDDCCACPSKCASQPCTDDLCSDGSSRREIDGQCCACPPDPCDNVDCAAIDTCPDGTHLVKPPGACCASCERDCSTVKCAFPQCKPGQKLVKAGCCYTCEDHEPCPPGAPTADCFARPCDVKSEECPQGYHCEDDYCGGCNALCIKDKEVNCDDAVCIQDVCWDNRGRRQIGDDCCACPPKPVDCTNAICTQDVCWDNRGRRQIGDDCCACPPKPTCADAVCTQDVCWDNRGRRQIGDDCCACPPKPQPCDNVDCTDDLCKNGEPRRQIGDRCCACAEEVGECDIDCAPGQKCVYSPKECLTLPCPQWECRDGSKPDCSAVSCAKPLCEHTEEIYTPENECCPQCRPKENECHLVDCNPIDVDSCGSGETYVPEGECCERCRPVTKHQCLTCDTLPAGVRSYFDGCNNCHCDDNGNAACTEKACALPAFQDPFSCAYKCDGWQVTSRDGCETCACRGGQRVNCRKTKDCSDTNPDCRLVDCAQVKCDDDQVAVVPDGQCCPVCRRRGQCPDGTPQVDCFANPCANHKCNSDERCVPNYCGGCSAECKPIEQPTVCPDVECEDLDCDADEQYVKEGECCPSCRTTQEPCADVACDTSLCENGQPRGFYNGECCACPTNIVDPDDSAAPATFVALGAALLALIATF